MPVEQEERSYRDCLVHSCAHGVRSVTSGLFRANATDEPRTVRLVIQRPAIAQASALRRRLSSVWSCRQAIASDGRSLKLLAHRSPQPIWVLRHERCISIKLELSIGLSGYFKYGEWIMTRLFIAGLAALMLLSAAVDSADARCCRHHARRHACCSPCVSPCDMQQPDGLGPNSVPPPPPPNAAAPRT